MKIQRALSLPVLLFTLIIHGSDARAQAPTFSPGEQPQSTAVAVVPQTPLGIPTRLGQQQNGSPASFGGGGHPGYGGVAPAMMPQSGAPLPGMGMPHMGMPGMGGGGPMRLPGGPASPGMLGPGGPSGVMPASFGAPMGGCPSCGGGGCPACGGGRGFGGRGMGGPQMGGCPNCGGAGCSACGLGGRGWGLLDKSIEALLPHAGGGWCEPRWFDVSVEAIYLSRDDVSRRVNIMSDGVAGLAPPNIVLSTDNIGLDDEAGFRATAALQFGASSNLEFSYVGGVSHAGSAQVTSNIDNLFSSFSQFGNAPPPSLGPPVTVGGFTDSDSAELASITYSSNFDSIEMDFRRRWMAPNCRVQGSWLMGVRYFMLEEHFGNFISVNYPDPNPPNNPIVGFTNYSVETVNSMTGFQLGGDLWTTMVPGVRVGVEGKSGIFYNRADQLTRISATSLAPPTLEALNIDTIAFLAELNLLGVYRFNENFSVRAGYQFLYVDGVALATENFNPGAPFVAGARNVAINHSGAIFYHGATGGFEWMW
jgi:hypothetical protein